jgi:hypothetical protein
MRVAAYLGKGENILVHSMAKGMSVHGEEITFINNSNLIENDLSLIFGVYSNKFSDETNYRKLVIENQIQNNKPTLIVEKGFINRRIYHSAGFGNQCGRGIYFNENMPSDRFEKTGIKIKPWRKTGGPIILCGQIPWDTSVQHINYQKWLIDIIKDIKKYTDRKIIFRPHPKRPNAIKFPSNLEISTRHITEDLNDAWAVVAYNSNSALESILEGVPAFVFDKGSMVYNIANTDIKNIENPILMEREQTFYNISYSQWNIDEMESGEAWLHLKNGLNLL